MKNDENRTFKQGEIESIAKILGSTLTGSEISLFLSSSGFQDDEPNNTKWKRLYYAFAKHHNENASDNRVLSFISKALEPARFTGKSNEFYTAIEQINTVLSFHGLSFHDDGKFHKVKKATTLSEAENRVNTLKKAINDRNLHPGLLQYCKTEIVTDNYFHAVLEASKGIAETIRQKTNLQTDGVELIDNALAGNDPLLRINNFMNDTEKSEQRGFVNLLKGLFGTFRNPTAHAPKIIWNMEEEDALDLFTLASYAYRRIDKAKYKI
jgi:uncharacterized protein (TIGR02391 family)